MLSISMPQNMLPKHLELSVLTMHLQLAPNPMIGKAGQIKSVHAVDFMCHKNFEVEFG